MVYKRRFVEDDVIARNDLKKSKKKIIEIKVSFKGRLEMFIMKIKLFGFGGFYGVGWKDVKELFKPKKLKALFG